MITREYCTVKMADFTDTNPDGKIVKMEVDYSTTVDEKLPKCEALTKVRYSLSGLLPVFELCVRDDRQSNCLAGVLQQSRRFFSALSRRLRTVQNIFCQSQQICSI